MLKYEYLRDEDLDLMKRLGSAMIWTMVTYISLFLLQILFKLVIFIYQYREVVEENESDIRFYELKKY